MITSGLSLQMQEQTILCCITRTKHDIIMKKTLCILALQLLVCQLFIMKSFAQENEENTTKDTKEVQTLFGNNAHFGFFIAPVIKGSTVLDEPALFPGLRVGWTINRVVSLGIEGYGLAPTMTKNNLLPNEQLRPLMGYGGFFIEPVIGSKRLIHITTPIMVGAGWIGYVHDWNEPRTDPRTDDLVDDVVVWVVEPGINAELNVASFFRVNLGLSYRFTQNVNLINTAERAFGGLNYSLTLKFGRF